MQKGQVDGSCLRGGWYYTKAREGRDARSGAADAESRLYAVVCGCYFELFQLGCALGLLVGALHDCAFMTESAMTDNRKQLNFSSLVEAIRQVHEHCSAHSFKAINVSLTLRNWIIGYYILEYEQRGSDRAEYGERLLESLSGRLQHAGMSRAEPRELRRYRQFYLIYSRIWESLTPELRRLSSDIGLPVPEIRDSASPEFVLAGAALITSLSFTHLSELMAIDDPLERAFYEVECIRGNWSVRELKRQIGSLYFERSGLSKDKEKLAARVKAGAETFEPRLAVRDPYVFEFLGLRSREVMGESDLEDALLDRLQEFLLELGHGFCFEARQKRVLIGDTHPDEERR